MQTIKNKTEDFLKSMSEIHSDFDEISIKVSEKGFDITVYFLTYVLKTQEYLYSAVLMSAENGRITDIMYNGPLEETLQISEGDFKEKSEEFIEFIEKEPGENFDSFSARKNSINFKR